ncbi:MAG: diguanylate cyclase response regulator, partial [Pseudomonadota bacterium]
EVLIALPDTSLARAKEIANRVCRTTRTEPFADDVIAGGIAVSVSVGLTLHTGAAPRLTGPGIPPETPSEITAANLVQRADAALYSAKQGGRDKVHVSRAA